MDFHGNFRYRGAVDVSPLRDFLRGREGFEWSDAVAVSAVAGPHKATRHIFAKHDLRPEHLYGTLHEHARDAFKAAEGILAKLRPCFAAGYFVRLQFARQWPGDGFERHTDGGFFTLINCHRMHIAVETNKKVWFSVGEERKHMAAGEVWEINNARPHEGRNEGRTPRIHMIVDVARPLYTVEDRLRYFVNLESMAGRCGSLLCRPQLKGEPAPAGLMVREGSPPEAGGRVAEDVVVSVNYRLKDAGTGAVLSEDSTSEPLSYVHGHRQLPPAFEKALAGRKVGEPFSVTVPPEAGYGARYDSLAFRLKDRLLPKVYDKCRNPRVVVGGRTPIAFRLPTEDRRIVDANHPFAGRRLLFEGKIKGVRALDPDEYKYAVHRGATIASRPFLEKAICGFADEQWAYPAWYMGAYRVGEQLPARKTSAE